MDWKLFRELSDVKSTLLDLCLLILVISYSYTKYMTFDFINGLLGFLAVVIFHLIINFHNNFNIYKTSKSGIFRQKIDELGINRENINHAKRAAYFLAIIPIAITAYLVYSTGWLVLVVAILGIVLGVIYTSGPKPLNKTVIGEMIMTVITTVIIPVAFICLGLITSGKLESSSIIDTIVICLPNTFAIFATIIASSASELDSKSALEKNTLVERIGKHNSTNLFKASLAVSFLLIPILALMQVVPYIALLLILVYPGIWDNFRAFLKDPVSKNVASIEQATMKFVVYYVALLAIGAIISVIMNLLH